MRYRKIIVLIQIIVLACASLLSELQIHEYGEGLLEENQPIKRFPETTVPITTAN